MTLFLGALGGIFAGFAILLVLALLSLIFIEVVSFFFKKEILVIWGTPFALLGAAFPKYTKHIGENLLSHWP